MTSGEIGFLILVVAGMSAFCLTLAWTSWMNARGK